MLLLARYTSSAALGLFALCERRIFIMFCTLGHALSERELYILISAFELQARVKLTRCNQGWVVRKLVNANPGLKVDQSINFSRIQIIFTAFCFL